MDDLKERIKALDELIHRPMQRKVIPRYQDNPEWHERRIKPIESVEGAQMLVNAIVGEITADYVHNARALIRRPTDDYSRYNLLETEAFVRTNFFAQLTQSEMDADTFIRSMRRNVFNANYRKYKSLKQAETRIAEQKREWYAKKKKERGEKQWDEQSEEQRRVT